MKNWAIKNRRFLRSLGDERGIALILSLFMMLATSIVAASLMFLSQTETYATMNYRMMSQSRYGAESGIQMASNYLLYTYVAPSTAGGANGDVLANYVTTTSPVTYMGSPVILSANPSINSNYPISAVKTAFANAFAGTKGQLAAGGTTIVLTLYATLMSMEEVPAAKSVSGAPFTIQTWQLTSDGTITAGARTALVEVSAVMDTQKVASNSPAVSYAAFATSATCGALQFSGGATTKSFDSSTPGFNPASGVSLANGDLQTSCTAGGHDSHCNTAAVGTNGNLTESGGATINGTLSTPRVGVGSCSSGNVDADSSSGGATVTGGLVQLPQAVNLATPNIPAPALGTPQAGTLTINGSSKCTDAAVVTAMTLGGGICSGGTGNLTFSSAGSLTLPNITLSGGTLTIAAPPSGSSAVIGNVSASGGSSLALGGGTVNMTSLTTSGGAAASIGGGTYNTNSVSISGGTAISLTTQSQVTMNVINTITMSGGGSLNIPADTGAAHPATVNLNVVATVGVATPIDFSGGSVLNNSMDASRFQIQYGGTGAINLSGGTKQAEAIYAPKAAANFSGGSALYGEVIAATVIDSGGATIYYDRNLANKGLFATLLWQTGNPMLSSFGWKRF